MNNPFRLVLLLVIAAYVSCYPRNVLSPVETIDCSNAQLVRVLEIVRIPFRCIQTSNALGETTYIAENYNNKEQNSPKWYGSILKNVKVICPNGTSYNKEKNSCLPSLGLQILSLRSEQDIPLRKITKLEKPECEDGTVFNPINGVCSDPVECDAGMKYNPVTNSCHPISRCKPGTIYNPSIDLCLPHYSPNKPQSDQSSHKKIVSSITTDSPQRITLSPIKKIQVGKRRCPVGSVYVSEIDLCIEN